MSFKKDEMLIMPAVDIKNGKCNTFAFLYEITGIPSNVFISDAFWSQIKAILFFKPNELKKEAIICPDLPAPYNITFSILSPPYSAT